MERVRLSGERYRFDRLLRHNAGTDNTILVLLLMNGLLFHHLDLFVPGLLRFQCAFDFFLKHPKSHDNERLWINALSLLCELKVCGSRLTRLSGAMSMPTISVSPPINR